MLLVECAPRRAWLQAVPGRGPAPYLVFFWVSLRVDREKLWHSEEDSGGRRLAAPRILCEVSLLRDSVS